MEQDIAIEVDGISKKFKLPHQKESSIKGLFLNSFKAKSSYEQQHVISNLSFSIKKGEFFGVVGRNGSGKSTLLKMLAGIYQPDKGLVKVEGRLTPFIELGVGFNEELSGRENVYLNCSLLGFSRKDVDEMYGQIVEFAELEKFMDQKLKNYSSGMQVRLAFSIAIQARGDVMLFDEVLAVGDANFQKKCLDYFESIKGKKTVVLVSHDMDTIRKFCDRILVLEKSKDVGVGPTADMLFKYDTIMKNESDKYEVRQKKGESGVHVGNNWASINQVNIISNDGKVVSSVAVDDNLRISLKGKVNTNKDVKNGVITISIFNQKNIKVTMASKNIEKSLGRNFAFEVLWPRKLLTPGEYKVNAGLFIDNMKTPVDHFRNALTFQVDGEAVDYIIPTKPKWESKS